MKPAEIRELTDDEIRERISQVREEMFRLRFRAATQELENPALPKLLRRDLARLKTILHMRHLAGGEG
ncbi:MAG TPA: 50S ribosomal protein L29 [Longimicrobiales bacterium]